MFVLWMSMFYTFSTLGDINIDSSVLELVIKVTFLWNERLNDHLHYHASREMH
ncbi:hypothetical protein RchiOBHm_Chr4g0422721 [Rosa chinensis]|uniref:Uncharacterized protein n=1 Tax=Rosa chinensis TaxID=74649 RepID=A0A2P6QYJ8_ROSCH|nr:hypothetical protein RchiOBHm_Chr4g0422721 [Rosa chinensis]